MNMFQNIKGNQSAKEYFSRSITTGQLSHSYIFEGPYGVGKNTFAIELAKTIMCEAEGDEPCNVCEACHMIDAKTHPDLIVIEKDTNVTKVDNIRDNLIREMGIKPYRSKHKIVIVKAADTVNVQGQNAMLKTIEEPPSYGIVILVCENAASLLPTIRSRCINVRFNPLNKAETDMYLQERGVSGTRKEVMNKLSSGSIGVINDILEDEHYMEVRSQAIGLLEKLDAANLIDMYDLVKEITEAKEDLEQILQFWLLWYRDVAVCKMVKSNDLYYLDYQKQLLDMSSKLTYNKVSQNIGHIKKAILDIKQNIYSTFVIENLLLQMKESKK